MKATTLAIAASLCLPVVACDQQGTDGSAAKDNGGDLHAAFADLTPNEVQKLIDDGACTPVDVNGTSTREKYGIVPGAVLLAGSDAIDGLPDDKASKLVFYCGGKACNAAPKAAKLAQAAGYKDVSVMREGIRGWVDAGKKVDKPAS